MTIVVYNSLSRQKEPLIPLQPGKIGLYVCGMTVYDRCHLGHARSMVCFDVIVRFLRFSGLTVTYVRNITDIDDKIILRSAERGISFVDLTQEQIALMHDDTKILGILPPDYEPCASQHLPQIIALIQRLYDAGYAYVTAEGDVCFQVEKFKDYGKLSQQNLSKLMAGSRIEVNEDKLSPFDFVLWKKAKPNEPAWISPWGAGRPGWHIECSAMAMAHLGEEFDIHGGGLDLQFPHHENEIAQSEAASEHSFAKYWLHVGMLQVNDEKMSKSLGNFLTIADVVQTYHPEIIRFFLLSSHYRSTLNYSHDTIINGMKALMRLYQSLRSIPIDTTGGLDSDWIQQFVVTMEDDFNTPEALAVLFQLSHEINKTQSQILAATLRHLGGVLGILQHPADTFLQSIVLVAPDAITKPEIEQLITERNQAREDKNWQRADDIRQALLSQGIELEDVKSGTIWRRTVED